MRVNISFGWGTITGFQNRCQEIPVIKNPLKMEGLEGVCYIHRSCFFAAAGVNPLPL